MFPILIGISSALIYGAADFLGGLGSQKISPLRVTAISGASGFVLLLVLAPAVGGDWSLSDLLLGAACGLCGAVAICLLYACLAIGPMSILSPLTAVVSAIVPLSIGLASGEQLTLIDYLAIGLALIAVVLVGFVPEKQAVRPSIVVLLMAVTSGVAIGVFLALLDLAPENSGLLPLLASRGVHSLVMFATIGLIALLRRRRNGPTGTADSRGWRAGLGFALACGVVDAIANLGLLFGLRIGELSVMSVLIALYPAGTILLAATVLRERIAPVQYLGLALALIAGGLFALA